MRQHDNADCAAACLAMVAAAHGRRLSVTSLREATGTDARGASVRGILRAAGELGLEARAVRVDREQLLSSFTLPAIAQVFTPSGDTHFVVLHRIGQRHVLVGDPGASRAQKVGLDEFLATFSGVLILLSPTPAFEPGSAGSRSTLRRFVALFAPQWRLFVWAAVSSLVLTVLGIAGSLVTKVLFDEVVPFEAESLLLPVFLLFVSLLVVQHLVQFVRQWMILHLSQRIDLPLILGYFRHIYSLPVSFFAARPVGDVLTRFADALTIKNVLTGAALTVVMDIVMAVVTGGVLASMDRDLFMLIVGFVVLSVALVVAFRRPFRRVNQAQMEQASRLNSRVIEGLRGVEGIKLEANEDREMEGVEREYVRSLRIGFREGMLGSTQATLSSLLQAVVALGLLVLGVARVLRGDLTLGGLTAFIALSGFFIDPITRLVGLQLAWQEASLSLRRLGEVFEVRGEEASQEPRRARRESGAVQFEAVSFSYGSRAPALDDLSFCVEPGAKVAFVGPSGSGKSTVAKLLVKLYPVEQGTIRLGGVDVRDLDVHELRRSVGYVPQAVELYSRSVADNVRLSVPDASDTLVRESLGRAQARDFVERLPHRMATVLDEAGAGLAGGERRRLGIARALLKRADLYVFDEATSDLDAITESRLVESLFDELHSATVVFIAHRLATVIRCDTIFVMDGGRLVEQGTHDQLLAGGGLYASMWAAQQISVPGTGRRAVQSSAPPAALEMRYP